MRIVMFLLALWLASPAAARLQVVASVEPLAMLAREVLGEQAQVQTLLLPSQNPHSVAFTPGQARMLAQADLVVWLGEEAEPHAAALIRRRAPASLAMLSLSGIERLEAGAHDHEHAHGEPHEGGDDNHDGAGHGLGLDRHLWLSPGNMGKLAEALAAQVPGASAAPFLDKLARTDTALDALLAPLAGQAYLSHHDPWAYLAQHFGLQRARVISDSVEGSASARRFAELARMMTADDIRCALMEPEARAALIRRLCQQDCQVVELDPLGRDQAGALYSDWLGYLGRGFAACLAGPGD